MPVVFKTILLLTVSNVFMTFAWYAHLKNLNDKPWFIAAFLSWGIALFEYQFQVSANRMGFTVLLLAQLKVMQEAITLAVFVPFAIFLYAAASQTGFSVGRTVPDGGGLFHVQGVSEHLSHSGQRL